MALEAAAMMLTNGRCIRSDEIAGRNITADVHVVVSDRIQRIQAYLSTVVFCKPTLWPVDVDAQTRWLVE